MNQRQTEENIRRRLDLVVRTTWIYYRFHVQFTKDHDSRILEDPKPSFLTGYHDEQLTLTTDVKY